MGQSTLQSQNSVINQRLSPVLQWFDQGANPLRMLMDLLRSWRLGRVVMLAMVTGSTAYGFGATLHRVMVVTLIATSLAVGGFYLDYVTDWQKDREGGKWSNPIARGALSPQSGRVIVVVAIGTSIVLAMLTVWQILFPLLGVILIVAGLGIGLLDTPILRAFSLGALQALYVLIGGVAAGNMGVGVILTALFLFFAMNGARVIGDVRDLASDSQTGTMTIPRRYGLPWALRFLIINEITAYLLALMVSFVALGVGYFYCVLAIIVIGSLINLRFVCQPTAQMANWASSLSLGLLGSLYTLGMILGRTM